MATPAELRFAVAERDETRADKRTQAPAVLSRNASLFRVSGPSSRRLLIVNKGPGAAKIAREGRSWDLMEIFWHKDDIDAIVADPSLSKADHLVFESDRRIRKLGIIKRLFARNPVFWSYDVVMMADDDLYPIGCTIKDIFDLFETTGQRVGQPALTRDSYWAHDITLRDDRFRWRKTNFVEVMCPIMTREALQDYIGVFDETAGHGLDEYWSQIECGRHGGLAVLDATPVRHTRPVQSGAAYEGVSAGEEGRTFLARYRLKRRLNVAFAGELSTNRTIQTGMNIVVRSYVRGIVSRASRRLSH